MKHWHLNCSFLRDTKLILKKSCLHELKGKTCIRILHTIKLHSVIWAAIKISDVFH